MNDFLKDYLKELDTNTANAMSTELIPNRELAFTHYILTQIAAKVGAENFEVIHADIKDSAGKYLGEIFAYNESSNQEVLTLFYTIYGTSPETNNKVLTDTDVQYAWNRLQGFYDRSIRGAHFDMDEDNPAYQVAKTIYENNQKYQTIRFYILSNYIIKRSEPKKIRVRSKETDNNVWDLNKLAGNLTNNSDHVEINIDFENDNDYNNYKIPYIQMTPNNSGYRCLLMMFPAKLLYKLYRKWNTDLLMYNVRFWLTFKKTKRKHTNSDIRETLRSERYLFLAYNNGLTAIATGIQTTEYDQKTNVGESEVETGCASNDMVSMGLLKYIKNFQIVNGGQTTASIFKAKEAEDKLSLNGAFVQVKLIVLSEDQNVNDLAAKISRSSNSQNAVKDSDFSVSFQFNTKMQELSRSIKIPNDKGDISYWFYERIRGQYESDFTQNKRREDKEAFSAKFPKKNKFTKEEMAIVRKSWEEHPCDAVKGSGTTYDIFISKIVEDALIPDEIFFKDTISLLIIYHYLKSRPENKTYKNAKASVIAYAIAYAHYITFSGIDLNKIWEKQDISDNQKNGFNLLCEVVFDKLNMLANEEETTVLSYGKRKDAFGFMCEKINGEEMNTIRNLLLDITPDNTTSIS